MNHNPSREAVAADTERRLRDAFAEAAYSFTPHSVPLAAIERDGRRYRRRRRATVVGTGAGLLLAPLAVLALRPVSAAGPSEHVTPPAATSTASPSPSASAGTVRVVAPGERVKAADGTKIWLTEKGKYWQLPDDAGIDPQFRSVVDGNIDMSTPGVGVQEEGSASGGYFLSGIYRGKSEAARVEIETTTGKVINGTVLRLAGNTEWGAWYANAEVPAPSAGSPDLEQITRKVTVYDAAGGVVAEMDFGR